MSYSGRCLLSAWMTGRSANRGACAQPCRWNYNLYEIAEEKRPETRFPLMETDRGTFILSSKDMCMLEHVPELMESGIASFKIEGRMKSAYYTAVVTNAYRAAIDGYIKNGADYKLDERWLRELDSVSHREYCTGYYFDDPMQNAQTCTQPGYLREKSYLAVCTSYDAESGTATFIQRNKAKVGDAVEIITPGKPGRGFVIDSMKNALSEDVESAPHPFMEFTVPVPFEVHAGDILRGAN